MATESNGFIVEGWIEQRWLGLAELAGARLIVGAPTMNEAATFDRVGRYQDFERGTISWHPDTGAFFVTGAILGRWNELEREKYGYPTTNELGTPDGAGRYNHFKALHLDGQERSIYWHPDTGAHEIYGWIRLKWAELGWGKNALGFPTGPVLGYPTGPEVPTSDGTGRLQGFQKGLISWHPDTGAHSVQGLISARWWELEREKYGYPITDELPTPDGAGRYNHFKALHLDGQERSIYWHPDTGAHEIYGWIRLKWAELGWEKSVFGYPVGPERDRAGGGRIQDFQNGSIAWTPALGAFVEHVHLRRRVVTPAGTALGGEAELELHRDGNYRFRGHMRGSGADPYGFRVRAAIGSNAGVALVAQKSGDVEGTLDGGLDPRRVFEWDEPGHSRLLQSEWSGLQYGSFGVSKAYENEGIVGGLGSVALDLLSFLATDVALGPHVALAILIGKEISEIGGGSFLGVGGLTGTFVTAGASYLMGPGYAIPIFVGTAVVTDALVETREMTAEEYDFANTVFSGTLPARSMITLTNLSGLGGAAFTAPNADGGVLLNLTDAIYGSPGGPMSARFGSEYPEPGQAFIHELTHAWQLARNGFEPGFVYRKAVDSGYEPPPAGTDWGDFSLEQEATTVDRWFGQHSKGWTSIGDLRERLSSEAAIRDPYFPYISNNIRMGHD
ncbi:MAG: hypothetical protein ABW065_03160 [Solirubrobacterales bacterium]